MSTTTTISTLSIAIVQIEVFDRFDIAADRAPHYPGLGWSAQPFNPKNNVNYTAEQSGLLEQIDTHPGRRENPFFRTTPQQEDNPIVLRYQEAFVDKMLSISLNYPNVLYCVSNETNESEHWSGYWARFLDLSAAKGAYRARWLEIEKSRWTEEAVIEGGKPTRLRVPGSGQWVVLIQPAK